MAEKGKTKIDEKEVQSRVDSRRRYTGETEKEARKKIMEKMYPSLSKKSVDKETKARQFANETRRQQDQLGQLSPEEKKQRGLQRMRNRYQSRSKPNQMDREDPTGIDIKEGGLVLRVSNRGPNHSSQNRKS
tara:strand:+ start:111 stop:506 length:396 start_codon:yes stop_codon:yes gene_type:complete